MYGIYQGKFGEIAMLHAITFGAFWGAWTFRDKIILFAQKYIPMGQWYTSVAVIAVLYVIMFIGIPALSVQVATMIHNR